MRHGRGKMLPRADIAGVRVSNTHQAKLAQRGPSAARADPMPERARVPQGLGRSQAPSAPVMKAGTTESHSVPRQIDVTASLPGKSTVKYWVASASPRNFQLAARGAPHDWSAGGGMHARARGGVC